MAASATTIINRHFECSKMRASGAHLHLQRPAVSLFAHVESLKSITTNCSERSHVGRAHAVQQAKKEAHHVSGKNLVPVHASSLTSTARARRNHEIMRPFNYRLNQPIHHFRVVTAVTVQKHDDFAISRKRTQPRAKRPPVPALRLSYHASASSSCNFRCLIGTAVIDDDYFVGNIARN